MRLALRAAELGRGRTRPNPVVGCVIVQDQRVLSVGHHARAGGPHAEIEALERARTSLGPGPGGWEVPGIGPRSSCGLTPPDLRPK